MKNNKMKRISSMLIAMIMTFSFFSGLVVHAGTDKFEIYLEAYNSDGEKIDLATDSVEVDEEVLVKVNYRNLSKLTDSIGIERFTAEIQYDYNYFDPVGTQSAVTAVDTAAKKFSAAYRNSIKSYFPDQVADEYYSVSNSSDKPSDANHRLSYVSFTASAGSIDSDTVLNAEEGTFMVFTYKAKKKTPANGSTQIQFDTSSGFFVLGYYTENTFTSVTTKTKYADMQSAGLDTMTPISLTISSTSGEPVVDTETGIIKNIDESTSKFDATSFIVVSGRTVDGGETTLPISSDTVANIYKVVKSGDPEVASKGTKLNATPVAATETATSGVYEIKIPLDGYDDEDFIVTVITNYGDTNKEGDESEGLLIEAVRETPAPVVAKENVTKEFAADGKLANSDVKVYRLEGQTADGIDAGTVFKLYDAETDGNLIDTFTKADDGNDYISITLSNDDKVVYLSAQKTGMEESATRTAVPYLLSKKPANIVVENNWYDNSEATNSYIKINSVRTGSSVDPVAIKAGTTFNLYSSKKDGASETVDSLISSGITASEDTIEGTLTKILTLDKKAMGEDGTAYWISAVEPEDTENGIEYIESEKVFISAVKAGSTVSKIPPEEEDLSDDDKTKLEGKNTIADPVIIPVGTEKTAAALAEYGLVSGSGSQVAIYFEPAVTDPETGKETNIALIDVTWDITSLTADANNKLIIDTPDAGETYKSYELNGTLDSTQLKAAGIKVDESVYQPKANVRVVPNVEFDLAAGNATAADLAEKEEDGVTAKYAASDIFVYYGYKVTDPGITNIVNSDGTTTQTGTLKKYVKGEFEEDGVTPKYLTDAEIADRIAISDAEKDTTHSKTVTICYEYTDPTYDILTKTLERKISTIFMLGDVSKDGQINEADSGIIERFSAGLDTTFSVLLANTLFLTRTANVDADSNNYVNESDSGIIQRYSAGLETINQRYAFDKTTSTMTLGE